MRKNLALLSLLLAAAGPAATQELLLTNAQIVDPARSQVHNGSLLIVDGHIVGSPTAIPEGFAGETLDLGGMWVMPGLVDLHTHSYGNMAPGNQMDPPGTAIVAKRMLYAGVTAFLDLFGDEETMYALRSKLRAGEVEGAELFASLSCLTATEGHCTEYGVPTRTMDTPDEARRTVADLAVREPDVVKIVYAQTGTMPSIDKPTLVAAVAAATGRGIRTVVHVNTWQDVRDAVAAGASAVTHVPASEEVPPDLARDMAVRGVASIPTLAVETDFLDFVTDESVLANPLATALTTTAIIDAYRSDDVRAHVAEDVKARRRRTRTILSSVKTMADVGVTILAGTDAGNWGTIQGYSLHRELVKLVAAGLSSWDALAAATTRAGAFLGRSFGVSAGDEANLVVLDASPIDDIRNTQRIVMIIQRGRVVNRDRLLAPAPGDSR
ncbi:MAG: amidohydrolase family protein [Gemmatimonadota bacterium]|nr:amidohydrolase family protein [Gemmatimonadota bacterium]